ncbi:MAG: thioredoxin domain-containing protein, partial [Gallionella sp.]|nr:thioredoxin domain-containing protein [Gallionella sp.]
MSLILDENGNSASPSSSGLIKDVGVATFAEDVLKASMTTPVIVDFWSPRSGPCKQLLPLLEKLVTQMRGAVRLAKVNVDENPEIAAQFRVQTVPAVFAVVGGRPVDAFTGALPENQLKAFIQRLTKGQVNPIDEALEHAALVLAEGDAAAAEQVYRQVLEQDPANVAALAGVLRCLLAKGAWDQARELLAHLPAELSAKPEIVAVATSLELLEQGAQAGEAQTLRLRLAANANDHAARLALANALFAAADAEGA